METGLVSWHVSIRIADHNRSDDDKKKKKHDSNESNKNNNCSNKRTIAVLIGITEIISIMIILMVMKSSSPR